MKLYWSVALFFLSALLNPLLAEDKVYSVWDKIEDAAESVGAVIEENWEKLEDAVIPETEEERREEAQERAEDAAEEAEEERRKQR